MVVNMSWKSVYEVVGALVASVSVKDNIEGGKGELLEYVLGVAIVVVVRGWVQYKRFWMTMVWSSMMGFAPMASDMPQLKRLTEKPVRLMMNSPPTVRVPMPFWE